MKYKHVLAIAPLAFFAIGTSNGALVIEESFDYADGGINGQNGGSGFDGAWANTRNGPTVASPGFAAGDLDVAGGYARGAAWSGIARPISTTTSALYTDGLMADGATLWFSVIFGLVGQNTSNADISIALTDSTKFHSAVFGNRENLEGAATQGIGLTHSGGTIQGVYWTDLDAGADTVAERTENSSSVAIGGANPGSALIVGKIEWGTGGAGETLTLYAPDSSLNLGAPVMSAWSIPDLNQTGFNNLAIQFKDQSQVDEIRFGAEASDVLPAIPEPSSVALLGLAALGLASRRRR